MLLPSSGFVYGSSVLAFAGFLGFGVWGNEFLTEFISLEFMHHHHPLSTTFTVILILITLAFVVIF